MLPKKVDRTKTPEQALASLQRLCARAEKSSGDALRLMTTWKVEKSKQHEILQQLLRDKFIDDERYAEAFIREKTSLSTWGEYKIRTALRRKGIAEEIINSKLNLLDNSFNIERLTLRLQRKARNIKYDTTYQLKTKLLRYGLSLGFQMDQVMSSVEQVMKNINQENECEEDIFF
ncbi:MAG: RecX family transcriptional regulator [Alistipes sp.]|nr:RecX family transcriptional regulator [Alistipes sp.]